LSWNYLVGIFGWAFAGKEGTISPEPKRKWKLHYALEEALTRGQLSGKQLSRLVGHYVSMAMVRRESLSVLDACYAFIIGHPEECASMWPSVMREFMWMRDLLPLICHDMHLGLSERV